MPSHCSHSTLDRVLLCLHSFIKAICFLRGATLALAIGKLVMLSQDILNVIDPDAMDLGFVMLAAKTKTIRWALPPVGEGQSPCSSPRGLGARGCLLVSMDDPNRGKISLS